MAESTSSYKYLYSLFIIIVIMLAGSSIAKFFNISFAAWGPYMIWFCALAIFYILLPAESGKLFTAKSTLKLTEALSGK